MNLLNKGDLILVDFDGVIAEAKRPDGTDWYPEMGPVRPGIQRFLSLCKQKGIIVEVWSARTNADPLNYFPEFGDKAAVSIALYMTENDLFYTRINRTHKPLGAHHAKYLLDDRSFNFISPHGYSNKLFGE